MFDVFIAEITNPGRQPSSELSSILHQIEEMKTKISFLNIQADSYSKPSIGIEPDIYRITFANVIQKEAIMRGMT